MTLGALLNLAGWPNVHEDFPLDSATEAFIRNEITGSRTRAYYCRRLLWMNAFGFESVVDAGCGLGQWTMSLAQMSERVVGIEPEPVRAQIAERFVHYSGLANAGIIRGTTENMPIAAESADLVFCYGVLMFTNVRATLSEFLRVLRPGGWVYVTANALGWYAHLLFREYGSRRYGLYWPLRTALGFDRQISISPRRLRYELVQAGFVNVGIGADGHCKLPRIERSSSLDSSMRTSPVPPAYPPRYFGLPGVIEAVAQKPSIDA